MMALNDDAVVAEFIHSLDAGEMQGQFADELRKLSYPQLLILARTLAGPVARKDSITHPLTAREREILTLIASGKSSRQIAERLGVAFRTVVAHRDHIYRKLGVHKTADLTRVAIRMGLIEFW